MIFFFSNDFGLIDIEKTAIITAISIDSEENGDYLITAQVAVPEATDVNNEDKHTEIKGRGATIGSAIKSLSDYTGWFPQLTFCNLLLISKEFDSQNLITVLDYFSNTLRLQDSALLVFTDGKANELLKASSPLDSISSFAIQKVLLKKSGFDKNVAPIDVRGFCSGYYAKASSSYMPVLSLLDADTENGGSSPENQGQSQENNSETQDKNEKKVLFNAKKTALFKNGVYVGELNEDLTQTYNMLTSDFTDSTLELKNVFTENDGSVNFLILVEKNGYGVSVNATENGLSVNATLDLKCKIVDDNSSVFDYSLSKNTTLPNFVKTALKDKLSENVTSLFQKIKSTGCDFLQVKEKLYRYNFKQYNRYKDNYLDLMTVNVNVTVNGQK